MYPINKLIVLSTTIFTCLQAPTQKFYQLNFIFLLNFCRIECNSTWKYVGFLYWSKTNNERIKMKHKNHIIYEWNFSHDLMPYRIAYTSCIIFSVWKRIHQKWSHQQINMEFQPSSSFIHLYLILLERTIYYEL